MDGSYQKLKAAITSLQKTERSEAFETLRIFAPSRLCACGVQRITAPLRAEVVVDNILYTM